MTGSLSGESRRAEHYAAGFWQDQTIYQLAQHNAVQFPNNYAIRDRYRRLTFQELISAADELADDLAANGVAPGQVVGVWLPSRLETAITLLACSRNGAVCCPSLHRNHTNAEIATLLKRADARAFISEQGYGADAKRLDIQVELDKIPALARRYSLAPLAPAHATQAPFFDAVVKHDQVPPPPTPNPDTLVYLPFTSGTSGAPKGVMHSDNTLLANALAMAADWHFDRQSILYTISPLSHNLGFGALVTALAVGAELVVHDLPAGESLLARLTETGATFIFGVPTHAIDLLGELDAGAPGNLERVRGFRISGAPVPEQVAARLLELGVKPQSGYGMTEACSHHYTLPDDDAEIIIQSSGRACSGYDVKIFSRDDANLELPAREVGEIGGYGASLMLGYFNDPAATERALNNSGYFMTGDLGWLDENNYLRVTGRKKDVIIRGGHNIDPAQIEALAVRHPEINRAAAIPVGDERLGERVCLAVTMNATTDPQAILAHLAQQGLSRYDMPEYFLAVDEFPVTASGKILKRELTAAVADGRLAPQPIKWQG